VLFSKCDGVPCFPEFFAHLGEAEARRMMGATLPLVRQANDTADIYADREGKRLTHYFNRLYMALAEKRLVLLAREDQAPKKSSAYEFPRELKKLRGDVVQFLLDVFRPNPLQLGPRLRGFYLCGQRWIARNVAPAAEGTVAGFTVMPKRSDATVFFGSKPDEKPAAAPGAMIPVAGGRAIAKWMFLADLFHNVVLKDRTGHVVPRINTREQEYRNIGLAAAGALLLLVSIVWANSWRHNRELLQTVQVAVEAVHLIPAQAASTADSLAELDSLRGPLTTLLGYERHGTPLSYRWGLYAGHEVTTSLNSLYFERFRRVFLDPLIESFTSRFSQLDPNSPIEDDVYTQLKSYRMITSGTCKPDEEFLSSSLMPIWSSMLTLSSEIAVLAERQTQFYLAELTIRNPYQSEITENRTAVTTAQRYLRELNGPDKILRALLEQVNHEKQGEMLSSYAPNYGEVMTGPNSIDAAYTRQGWDAMMDSIGNHKLASAGETCVLGTQSAISNLAVNAETEHQVQSLYVSNYIQRWKLFLEAHHVESFHGTQDAARRLRVLADNNRSPLLGLVYMASHNTDLSTAQSGESTVSKAIEQTKESVSKRIKDVLGTKSAPSVNLLSPTNVPNAKDVMREFGPARAVVDPANAEKWLNSNNQAYVQGLEELADSLAAMPVRIDPKDAADQQAKDRADKALQQAIAAHHALGGLLPNTSSQVDVDLKALLQEPITYASAVIRGVPLKPPPPPPPDLTIPIRAQVNKSAQALCASVDDLRSKFPFNSGATQEATIQELSEIFAPNTGALARFAQSPDVSKTYLRQGKAWIPNPSFPGNFSQPFLQDLNAFSEFSDDLYADGTGNPHFDYTLTVDGTGRVPFELDVDGHAINYNPKKGPVTTRLVWPPVTNAPTRLTVKSSLPLPVQNSGLWSLFRLLQAADKQTGNVFIFSTIQFANGNKIPLQDSKGHPVTIQIRVDSAAANAFARGYFGKLRCENFAGWALR
jgi:type VI secretion system protein ImpL